jgi:hypothetical protein
MFKGSVLIALKYRAGRLVSMNQARASRWSCPECLCGLSYSLTMNSRPGLLSSAAFDRSP